jgi:hypothetical protein
MSIAGEGTLSICVKRPHVFSDTQVLVPRWHSNMLNIRPLDGFSMLVMNLGCSPHANPSGFCFSNSVCNFGPACSKRLAAAFGTIHSGLVLDF